MRLAYLYSRYPVVSQTFCDSEMLALEAQGLSLIIGSLNPPPTSFRHERLRDLRAEVCYPPPSAVLKTFEVPPAMSALAADHTRRYGAAFKPATRARNAAYFARLFERQGVDHIHVHFANRATHTALFLKTAGFPFSFTAHAQDYMVDLGNHDLLREMAREAEFVIAVSDFSRADLARLCPESAAKIHRVYNGLRPDEFLRHPPPATTLAQPFRLLSVGRLIEFKGFHHLIQAVRLLGEAGVDIELQIIGEGPWRERLERQIAGVGLTARIRLRGGLSLEQIKLELGAADAFALGCCIDEKGASDVLPTVIVEAMAAGLPVVSTRLAGVPELVEDGVTGLLCEPADAAALAERLGRLAADPALRRELGEAGRARCRQVFALDRTAAQVRALFEEAMAGRALRVAAPPAAVVCLTEAGAEPELPVLAESPAVRALAATGDAWQPWLDFLPDAIVLEADWRAHVADAARCEKLYTTVAPAGGEEFFRAARRAVHTAQLVRKRGLRHVHACRSNTLVWAWLVKNLTGVRASFAIEDHPPLSRAFLAELSSAFDFGTIGDAKLSEMTGHRHSDQLGLSAQRTKPLFRRADGAKADVVGWRERLTTIC